MNVGDRVADRYVVTGEAPGEPEVARFWATDDRGTEVEILCLRAPRDAREQRAFAEVHRRVKATEHASVVRVHAIVEGEQVLVVRDRLDARTAADLAGPLPPAVAASLGAQVFPAILAVGPAMGGALLPEDIGVDARGRPVLAPRGRPAASIARSALVSVAPETFAGKREPGGALWGLGVLLYRLSTGRSPFPETTGERSPPPAPSSWRADVPAELDRAILTLLAIDPAVRLGARVSGADTDLGPHFAVARPPAPLGEVRFTREPPALRGQGRADVRADGLSRATWLVVVPGELAAKLTPAQRSAVAGLVGLSESAVQELAGAGLPIVLEGAPSLAAAEGRVAALASAVDGLALAAVRPALGCLEVAGAIGSTAVFLGLGVVATFFVPWWVDLLLGVVLAGWEGWIGWLFARRWSLTGAVARREAADRAAAACDPAVVGVRARLSMLRRQIAVAPIPAGAAMDLREGLRSVEERVEALGATARQAEEALSRLDADRLRVRLAAADAAERERIARTLADVEAVQSRRDQARSAILRLGDTLDEVEAVLARADPSVDAAKDDSDAALRLSRTAALARGALDRS